MDIDPIGAIQNAVSTAPFAAIAAVILGGPTLLYLMFRTAFSRGERRAPSSGRMLWACPQCSSVNESVNDRCYTCHFAPQPEDDVTVIDPATGRPLTPVVKPWTVRTAQAAAPTVNASRPAVAVGPGRAAAPSRPMAPPPVVTEPAPVMVGAAAASSIAVAATPTSPSSESGVLHRVGVRRPFDPPSQR